MDVPSWHPANSNSDALRRLATSGGAAPTRTEFKEVDTSTEEERQQVATDVNVVLGGGRGLLDPSDRLYLLEQTQLQQQANSREQQERDAALLAFRSNALKVHAHKPLEIAVTTGKPLRPIPEKKAVVVIRAKKRRVAAEKEATHKKTKKMPDSTEKEEESRKKEAEAVASKSPASVLLLQDYSSSSDDE